MASSNNDGGLYDPYVKRGAEEGDASNARTQGLQRVSVFARILQFQAHAGMMLPGKPMTEDGS